MTCQGLRLSSTLRPFRPALPHDAHEPAQEPLHDVKGSVHLLFTRQDRTRACTRRGIGRRRSLDLRSAVLLQKRVTIGHGLAVISAWRSSALSDRARPRIDFKEAVLGGVDAPPPGLWCLSQGGVAGYDYGDKDHRTRDMHRAMTRLQSGESGAHSVCEQETPDEAFTFASPNRANSNQ
jgi:hypothetical protein